MSRDQHIREGKFQRQVAIVTGVSALLSGSEAYYSQYKDNFRYAVQWTPAVNAPLLGWAAFGVIKNRRPATTALPAISIVAGADAAVESGKQPIPFASKLIDNRQLKLARSVGSRRRGVDQAKGTFAHA